jgi:hypothetical protein
MNIIELLLHHFVALNPLWMIALLPELVHALCFVLGSEVEELIEQPLHIFILQMREDLLGGVALQVCHDSRKVRGGEDSVEVVVEDNPSVDTQPFAGLAVG